MRGSVSIVVGIKRGYGCATADSIDSGHVGKNTTATDRISSIINNEVPIPIKTAHPVTEAVIHDKIVTTSGVNADILEISRVTGIGWTNRT